MNSEEEVDAITQAELARRVEQLKNIRQCIGILEKAKRALAGAMVLVRENTPRDSRYAHRISVEYDNVKSIQDDISRRYLVD